MVFVREVLVKESVPIVQFSSEAKQAPLGALVTAIKSKHKKGEVIGRKIQGVVCLVVREKTWIEKGA